MRAAAVKRRLAAAITALGVVVSLWVAAAHWHELVSTRGPDKPGCVYCAGGIVATPAVNSAPVAIERVQEEEREVRTPESPSPRRLLPLAHSGNAPPA